MSVDQVIREPPDALRKAETHAAALALRNKKIEFLREQCIRLHQIKPETDIEQRWAAEGPSSVQKSEIE